MPAIRRYHRAAGDLPEKTPYRPATLEKALAELDAYPVANLKSNDAALLTKLIVVEGAILTELAKRYYGDPHLANWIFSPPT